MKHCTFVLAVINLAILFSPFAWAGWEKVGDEKPIYENSYDFTLSPWYHHSRWYGKYTSY